MTARDTALGWIEAHRADWSAWNRTIWEFGETAWREYLSADWYAERLAAEGFAVERGSGGMPTAFCAVWQNGPGQTIGGYLFDRRRGSSLADSAARLMLPSGEKVSIAYAEVSHIAFSDRDPAAGKSFETWVKKYIEKKLAGEKASIESEQLD